MSQAPGPPTDFVTEYAHAPPLCTQFSVFLENRVGRLYDLFDAFDDQPLRIVAFSILEASDHAVVRIITTKADLARQILRNDRLPYAEAEILIVELGPEQKFSQMCRGLLSAELSIHYAYSLILRRHGDTTVALHCDDPVLAGQILQRKGFKIVEEEELRCAAGEDPAMG